LETIKGETVMLQDTGFWEKAKKRAQERMKKPRVEYSIDPMMGRYRRSYGRNESTGQPIFEEDTTLLRQRMKLNKAGY
jgi:hypothetical protein